MSKKLRAFDKAMKELEGELIPYNLIVQYFAPLQRWLNLTLRGAEDRFEEPPPRVEAPK